ncbi:MAG: hypothetical protein H6555_06230 [Lewinellaceae bacterium]|nr:hypothetical protein [Lewinellaceae bacterium]
MQFAYKTLFAVALVGILALPGNAHVRQEFTKTIRKEFPITATGTTELINKYGKIDVKTWSSNKVKITVNIVVNASSESNAQRDFDRINVQFSNQSDYVRAETVIEPQKSRWPWTVSSDVKNDYSINYEVYLPASNQLKVDHRYGDLYVAAMTGKASLDVKYVNFKLEGIGPNSSLLFGYGNGTIAKAEDLTTEVSYSNLTIDQATNLTLNTKYTQVMVNKATDVTCTSRYDNYKLGAIRDFKNAGMYDNFTISSVRTCEVSGKYSQVQANNVTGRATLDLVYGSANIRLDKGFSEATINGRYTDVKVRVAPGVPYALEAMASYAGINYPKSLSVTHNISKSTSQEVRGYSGDKSAPMIRAQLSYGGMKLWVE